MNDTTLEGKLAGIVAATPWLMRALVAARALGLPQWCVGAGAVRNAAWDALYGLGRPSALSDVDVAFFDPSDLSTARDRALEERLQRDAPEFSWDVNNQAGVHLWTKDAFGHPVEPLVSVEDAIASWPETATAVAARLRDDDTIQIIAPLGLIDLFDGVIRRNAPRVGVETYRRRVAQKRYAERWPKIRIIAE